MTEQENLEAISLEELIKQDSADRVQERALAFADDSAFQTALAALIEKSSRRPIPFRPLGGKEDCLALVPDDAYAEVEAVLRSVGVSFEQRRVRSMGELSSEERARIKGTGERIG